MRNLSIHLADATGDYICIEQHSGVNSMQAPNTAREILKRLANDSFQLECKSYSLKILPDQDINKYTIVYEYNVHYDDNNGNSYYMNYIGRYLGTLEPIDGKWKFNNND